MALKRAAGVLVSAVFVKHVRLAPRVQTRVRARYLWGMSELLRSARLMLWVPLIGTLLSCGALRVPPHVAPSAKPELAVGTLLHDAVTGAWATAHVTPSAPASDAQFLRRVHLDLVGTIPTEGEARVFLANTVANKREKLVDKLLDADAFSSHWAAYWDDVLMGQRTKPQIVDRHAFIGWLKAAFKRREPWDRMVRDIVAAEGLNTNGETPPRYNVAPWAGPMLEPEAPVNGAVNWYLRFENPQDIAGTASRVFLGVQVQCAQCHDHKTEHWKQQDFNALAACFARARFKYVGSGPAMGQMRQVEVDDVRRVVPRIAKNMDLKPIAAAVPRTLDGTSLADEPKVRGALAAWMTARNNPWFAKAFVNRMWGHFMGRGFVNPVDDLRPANTAELPGALDILATSFTENGYDVRRLMRAIVMSEPYQLSAVNHGEAHDVLWSHFRTVPLGPYELVHSIARATKLESALDEQNVDLERAYLSIAGYYSFLFDVDEELEKEAFEGSITQALALLNGSLIGVGSSALPSSALEEVMALPSDRERVVSLYLRTLSRFPEADELAHWEAFVSAPQPPFERQKGAPPPPKGKPDPLRRLLVKHARMNESPRTRAYEDLFWALLNSSEFGLNH